MKFRTVIAIMLACAATGLAQEHMADTLRNGILEEDSKQQPGAAIQQYQAVMTQFAEARQTAATALFRMAECYRKQGNRPQAISAYQRLLKDFGDQTKLAAQSRTMLATTYKVTPDASPESGNQSDRAKFDKLMEEQNQAQAKIAAARARYRESIQNEMVIAQAQLATAQDRLQRGVGPVMDVNEFKAKLAQLESELAAFDAGLTTLPAR